MHPEGTTHHPIVRIAKVSDFSRLARLYTSQEGKDLENFHPFPQGMFRAKVTFFLMLLSRPITRYLRRIFPTAFIVLIVVPTSNGHSLDAFCYIRLVRRENGHYVSNMGMMVRKEARGRGLSYVVQSAGLIAGYFYGVRRFEAQVYAENEAALIADAKLGYKVVDGPETQKPKVPGPRDEVYIAMDLTKEWLDQRFEQLKGKVLLEGLLTYERPD